MASSSSTFQRDLGEDIVEFILNLDNVRLIEFGESDIAKFEVSKNGIGMISVESGNIKNRYVVSSLTK